MVLGRRDRFYLEKTMTAWRLMILAEKGCEIGDNRINNAWRGNTMYRWQYGQDTYRIGIPGQSESPGKEQLDMPVLKIR